MKIGSNPLQIKEARYIELVEINMVKITKDFDMEAECEVVESSEGQEKSVYPKNEEGLVDFLHRCKAKESKVMLCPICSAVFDKKSTKEAKNAWQVQRKENWNNNKPQFYFDKRGIP